MGMKRKSIVAFCMILMLSLAACGQTGTESNNVRESLVSGSGSSVQSAAGAGGVQVTTLDISDMFSDRDKEIGYEEESAVRIVLNGDSAAYESDAVSVVDNRVTISEEGTFLLSGNLNGQVVIDAEDQKLQLVLDGANISCENSAAIYVKNADKVFVTLASGSQNSLATEGEYVAIDDNNIDAALFSKTDLTLNGNGSLLVSSTTGNGITSKDDLVITSGTYTINTLHHGLEGKDSVRIADGAIEIACEQDGIHAGNDEDDTKGFIYIAGGELKIAAGDDGVHTDTQLVITGGTITITKSYEGLEGQTIEITGGAIDLVSSDDGLNAADGNDQSGFGGFGGDRFSASGENVYIILSGGTLHIDAGGDGIDSNGMLYVYGGEITVDGPENSGNGALDYNTGAVITGGTLVAVGASGMAENFGADSTQCSMMVTSTEYQEAGSRVILKDSDGKELVEFTAAKRYNNVVISCAEIEVGKTYTVTMGDVSTTVEMTETIYGSGMGVGGPGGGKGQGGFGGRGGENGQGDFGGRGGENGQGDFGGRGDRKNGNGEAPEDSDPSQIPEGFDPSQIPEGFDPGQMPEGFDPGQMPEGFDPDQMPEGADPGQKPQRNGSDM